METTPCGGKLIAVCVYGCVCTTKTIAMSLCICDELMYHQYGSTGT